MKIAERSKRFVLLTQTSALKILQCQLEVFACIVENVFNLIEVMRQDFLRDTDTRRIPLQMNFGNLFFPIADDVGEIQYFNPRRR